MDLYGHYLSHSYQETVLLSVSLNAQYHGLQMVHRVHKDVRDAKAIKGHKVSKDGKANRESRDLKDGKASKDGKVLKDVRVAKD
jgi:hypothetical protein